MRTGRGRGGTKHQNKVCICTNSPQWIYFASQTMHYASQTYTNKKEKKFWQADSKIHMETQGTQSGWNIDRDGLHVPISKLIIKQ